jgi:hypothetical protein
LAALVPVIEKFKATAAVALTLELIKTPDWTKLMVSPLVTPTKVPPLTVIEVVPS